VPQRCTPRSPHAQQLRNRRGRSLIRNHTTRTRHRPDPGRQPHQPARTQYQEHHSPSQVHQQQAAHKCSQRRPKFGPHIDQRIGPPAMFLWQRSEHPRVARIRHRLACTQHQPRHEQSRVTLCQPRSQRRARPHHVSPNHHPAHRKPVAQPSRSARDLQQCVAPEECRQQLAHLRRRHRDLTLNHRRRNR